MDSPDRDGTLARPLAIALAAVALLAVTVGLGATLGLKTRAQFGEVEASWRDYAGGAARKGAFISAMRGYLGYGGIIHNFKNYVLRQDALYLQAARTQIGEFEKILADFHDLAPTGEERAALAAIGATIAAYEAMLPVAAQAAAEGRPPAATDALVRVDDTEALAALATLEAAWRADRLRGADRLAAAVGQGRTLVWIGFWSIVALVLAAAIVGSLLLFLFGRLRRAVSDLRAELARRRIALADAERRLAETEIRAAFDGVLNDVDIAVGRRVSRNEQFAQLIDPEALEVAFRISTAQYTRLIGDAEGLPEAPVRVILDVFGMDMTAEAVLARASGAVDEGQSGRLLFARIDAPRGLQVGDFVRVEVEEPDLPFVARLPATAYGSDGQILLVGEDDRLEAVEVVLLRRQGDDVLVRARGLADRDVVLSRTPVLGDGIRIAPVRPSDGTAPSAPQTIVLDDDRRARLIAFVEGNGFIPDDVKTRLLDQLNQDEVPAQVVDRLESRMGS